jgi:hypothetical protein
MPVAMIRHAGDLPDVSRLIPLSATVIVATPSRTIVNVNLKLHNARSWLRPMPDRDTARVCQFE